MNIFELFGKIGIDNKSANKAIDETVGNAENGSGKIVSTFKKMVGVLGGSFAGKAIFDFGKSAVEVRNLPQRLSNLNLSKFLVI